MWPRAADLDSVLVGVMPLVKNRIFLRLRSGQALKRGAPFEASKAGIFKRNPQLCLTHLGVEDNGREIKSQNEKRKFLEALRAVILNRSLHFGRDDNEWRLEN